MAKEEEKKEDSVYDEEGREKLVEEGEMSSEEAGFMKGYEKADEEKKKMSLTKEEWNEEYKKRCDELKKLHPDWFQDKIKMMVSRDMPKQTDDGWE